MGDKVTVPTLGAVDNSSFVTELNNTLDQLGDEFDEVLYRDGTTDMEGDLDMGSNRIYNLGAPVDDNDAIRAVDLENYVVTYPNFTFETGEFGTDVVVTGTYPDLTVTVPRGSPGLSGALPDGDYNDIIVTNGGITMELAPGVVGTSNFGPFPLKTILGNATNGSATPTRLTVAEVKSLLALDLVSNVVDADRPISTDVQNALDLKAPIDSPVFTGNPTAPTAAPGDNDLSLANSAFVTAAITANNVAAATRTIPVMAGAMYPRFTNGCGSSVAETSTNKINFNTLDFDGASDEFAQFMIPMPKGWNEGTVTVQFLWRSTGGTGAVVWGIQAVAISDDDVADAAFGTAVTVTDTVTSTGDLMISSFSSAMTIAGTPAAEDLVAFQVFRDADTGGDTSTVDAQLVGIRIKYTATARDDS